MKTSTTFSFEFAAMTSNPFILYRNAVDDDVVSRFDSGPDLREFLLENGVSIDDNILMRDADGNGSDCIVPVSWIGDGERLFMSPRVLSRIE